MKLGTQTGSMTNHLMSNVKSMEPMVGMGATVLMWTDRHACTIIEVNINRFKLARRVTVQYDTAIRTDGIRTIGTSEIGQVGSSISRNGGMAAGAKPVRRVAAS